MKLGRNSLCLCGSGRKYKKCCLGKKDWETLLLRPDFTQHLSLRGKNTYFLNGVASILGLDPSQETIDWPEIKERVSPDHVAQIHEFLRDVWPSARDLQRILGEAGPLSGLYTGSCTPEAITRSVMRHALYSDTILMFDPFNYPGTLRPEYDPVLHPERHVSQTVKSLYVWFSLSPFINSGILKIIRSPADFDHALRWNSLEEEQSRLDRNPELKEVLDKEVRGADMTAGEIGWMTEYFTLTHAEDEVAEMLLSKGHSKSDVDSYLEYRKRRKRDHPFYTERRQDELLSTTFGESYGIARRVADTSGAFLLTDNQVRWKMIELDRREAGVDDSLWEPFAAAMQNTQLKYLDNLPLESCLKLRDDGLLDRMRSFLRRVWASARTDADFSSGTAEQFAAELEEEVAAAETEWRRIDAKLLNWFAGETAAVLAAAPSIGLANVGWLAASLGVMGIANLAGAQIKRRDLPRRMPGAFFIQPQ